MTDVICFNPRFPTPPPDIILKIKLSRQEAAQIPTRDMYCPVCSFKVAHIPVTQTEPVYVKCQKCKFEGPISPAYFRRMKRYYDEFCEMKHRAIR